MGDHKSGDEGAVPCEGILFHTVEQLLGQDAAGEKTTGDFWPRDQKKQNSHENAHQREITKVIGLLEISGKRRHGERFYPESSRRRPGRGNVSILNSLVTSEKSRA